MAGYLPIGGSGSGSGINLPDDHIFNTESERDDAIPNPYQGEQCAIRAKKPQYHLLQEYRGDNWIDITYLIQGPKGDDGGGSSVDPTKGFTLEKGASIKTEMNNGDSVDVIRADELKDLLIGNTQQCMQLTTSCNGIYVKYDEGEGKILLDDEGAPGIKLKTITDDAYCSFDYGGWATIITDYSSGDICYFVQSFKGASFSGLPPSITLDPDTDYVIASEVTQRKGSTGFAHRLLIISANQEDDANNRTIQRAGFSFNDAKNKWSEVMLKRDSVVFDNSISLAIEENNDEIITPKKGEQFQLIDSSKTSSYGNSNKQVTYFSPNVGAQSEILLSKLEYGKVFAIHEEVNSTKLIMIIHESLVAEIYNRDLTGVNELTMLFTSNSRGRLGKANQQADEQFSINWNGELIPANNNPNEINPNNWVAPDDSVTEEWSNNVKSVCYSNGILSNRGSSMLKRGDVIYSKPDSLDTSIELLETPKKIINSLEDSKEKATITYNDNSKFFVMPIVAGGGTFNVTKIFQLFMGRNSQYVEDWGSLKFDQSSDCIGTILKIAYDAAIAEEEKEEQTKNDQLIEGIASGFIYAKTVTLG